MPRPPKSSGIDPHTKKPLPDGVRYRGPKCYEVRKQIHGKKVSQTFPTARAASDGRKALEVDQDRGVFRNPRLADRTTLGALLRTYQIHVLRDDPNREPQDHDGVGLPYVPIPAVLD